MGVDDPDTADSNKRALIETVDRKNMLGEIMFSRDVHGSYGLIKNKFDKQYTIWNKTYPNNTEKCIRLLNNYKYAKKKNTSN